MPNRSRALTTVRVVFWVLAVVLGVLHAWVYRHYMNPDGVSYLDQADAWFRGDWSMAVNAWWSPGYPWLLGLAMRVFRPGPCWEFALAHMVTLVTYVAALGAFEFLLREVLHLHREHAEVASARGEALLPDWILALVGYVLFLWSSLCLIPLYLITPDMAVAAITYLACAMLLRIRRGRRSTWTFALLGLILGVGYLMKAPMLPLSIVFLGVAAFSAGAWRRTAPKLLMALAVLALVSMPFVMALSASNGRMTFGDSGRVNYAWWVNDVPEFIHWQGGPPGSGDPLHPTRQVMDRPAVYSFAQPVGGTYPAWYDPSYWYEGVRPHFAAAGQARAIWRSLREYGRMQLKGLQAALVAGVLVLVLLSGRRCLRATRGVLRSWTLLVPAGAGLLMFMPVLVRSRYVGQFVALVWLGLYAGVSVPNARRRVACAVALAVVTLMLVVIVWDSAVTTGWLLSGSDDHFHCRMAEDLEAMGVRPGDPVAVVGSAFSAYWARVLRVQIVAEMPEVEDLDLLMSDPDFRKRLMMTLRRAGAKAVVINCTIEKTPPGWTPLAHSGGRAARMLD